MEKFIELGFVCQLIFRAGGVVSSCIRDARTGEILFAGDDGQGMSIALLDCIEKAKASMSAQVNAMDNA